MMPREGSLQRQEQRAARMWCGYSRGRIRQGACAGRGGAFIFCINEPLGGVTRRRKFGSAVGTILTCYGLYKILIILKLGF